MSYKLLITVFIIIFISSYCTAQCPSVRLELQVPLENDYRRSSKEFIGSISGGAYVKEFYYNHPDIPLFSSNTVSGLWMGGYDQLGNLNVTISEYNHINNSDYYPGPIIDTNSDDEKAALCQFYNRVWTISENEVIQHKSMHEDGTLAEDQIPKDLLEWPAKNNPYLGQFTVDYDMAAFYDNNADGNYNPLDGDYPIALSEKPDFSAYQFNFSVYNGNDIHSYSRSNKFPIEIHQTKYISRCPKAIELDQSVFTRLKYIYKGETVYPNFKIGVWQDIDLGCSFNDHIGCSPEHNSTFIYSNHEMDCGTHIPVLNNAYAIRSTVYLNQEMLSFMPVGRPYDIPPSNVPSDPKIDLYYYQFLNNHWGIGAPLTEGGSGYDSTGVAVETDFIFPGLPSDTSSWASINNDYTFGDQKSITKIYDGNLMPGQEGIIDFVDHIKFSTAYDDESMFETYADYINVLKSEYSDMINSSIACDVDTCVVSCVWPGDIDCNGVVDGCDIILSGAFVGQESDSGPERSVESIRWYPYEAEDWDDELGEINYKFADVDGDGRIDSSDFYYDLNNFGYSLPDYSKAYEEALNIENVNLVARFEVDSIDMTHIDFFDRWLNLSISLGENDELLSDPIHGISFEMQIDSHLVYSIGNSSDVDYAKVFQYGSHSRYTEDLGNGYYLVDRPLPMIMSNYDGVDQTEGFTFYESGYFLRDSLATNNLDGRDTLSVRFFNVKAINSKGEMIGVGAITDELILSNLTYDADLVLSDEISSVGVDPMVIYPNPSQDFIDVQLSKKDSGSLGIYNVKGQLLMRKRLGHEITTRINVSELPAGMYFLRLDSDSGEDQALKFIKLE